jgi:hypothetical protein
VAIENFAQNERSESPSLRAERRLKIESEVVKLLAFGPGDRRIIKVGAFVNCRPVRELPGKFERRALALP